MNKVNLQQTGGFPLETDILDFMQSAYSDLQKLSALGGDNYILSGCVVTGGNTSDGVIVINGEVLLFQGGANQIKVIVKEDKATRIFENGSTKPVLYTRYATFGTGLVFVNFADLIRVKNIQTLMQEINARALQTTVQTLIDKVAILEVKAAPFLAGGGMVLWQKPFGDIPAGWAEVVDWRGRMPVGWNPDDPDNGFDAVGNEGGSATHTNIEAEMFPHDHDYQDTSSTGGLDFGDGSTRASFTNLHSDTKTTDKTGGVAGVAQEYSIMNPFRIVIFIEYVGL